MPLSTGSRLGPYEIVSPLGAGGMGEVYRARDTRLDRDVAIKVLPAGLLLDEASRSRFRKEAKALSRLSHPHVATLLDFGSSDGSDYLVMELVPGPTLDTKVLKGPLPQKDVVRLGAQLARGLKAAHDQGVIHRDLKPSNLCLTEDGLLKILDFGLARIARPAAHGDTDTDTAQGKVMGSPPYMPPEQVLGKAVDARTDIYSAGAVLYELATGRRPFGERTGAALTDAILHEVPESPRSVNETLNPGLEAVIVKALDKDPGLRYQTTGELLVDLERLQQGSEAGASGGRAVSSRVGHWSVRRRRGLRVLAAVLVLVALGFLGRSVLTKPALRSGAPRVASQLTFGSGAIMATWSPDGRMFAYCSDRSGNTDVWVQQVSGGDPIRITDDPASDCEPAWSPDGTQIAFWSAREGGGLYLVPALGGRARRLSALGHLPKWSRDGSKLLVVSALYESTYSIHVIDVARGDAHEVALPPGMGTFWPTADWHPDGQRISILGTAKTDGTPMFWTIPSSDGGPVQSEIPEAIRRQMRDSGIFLDSFLWAPSGDALYFQAWASATTNLFRVRVDRKSSKWLSAPEALTTSQGVLWIFSLSPDGKRLLYSSHAGEPYPLWSLPIEVATGRVRGEGQIVKAFGNWPQMPWLVPDGTRLTYESTTQGQTDLREQDLANGSERVLATNVEDGLAPRSADGTRIAYYRARSDNLLLLTPANGHEETIGPNLRPWDFSPDGRWLVSARYEEGHPDRLVLVSTETPGTGHRSERELLADRESGLWQAQFSPNGRWIVFEASGSLRLCTVRLMPAAGGAWWPLLDAALIARKPRWSPDGRILYFLRLKDELHNVWGLRFDPARGKPLGEPFAVTAFNSMIRHIFGLPGKNDFAVSRDRLVLPMEDYTNTSIWMLDNVDQ